MLLKKKKDRKLPIAVVLMELLEAAGFIPKNQFNVVFVEKCLLTKSL